MKRLKYNSFKIRKEGDIISIERLLLRVENLICILEVIGTTDIKYLFISDTSPYFRKCFSFEVLNRSYFSAYSQIIITYNYSH